MQRVLAKWLAGLCGSAIVYLSRIRNLLMILCWPHSVTPSCNQTSAVQIVGVPGLGLTPRDDRFENAK